MAATPPSPPPLPAQRATPPAVSPARHPAHSEATRLLCAGVYLDSGFRSRVIEELVEHEERPVAPSLGVDAVPVLAHALRARTQEWQTAALLFAVWIGFFWMNFAASDASLSSTSYDRYTGAPSSSLDWTGFAGQAPWALAYAWICLQLFLARVIGGRGTATYVVERDKSSRAGIPRWRSWVARYFIFWGWFSAVVYWIAAIVAVSQGDAPEGLLFPLLIAGVIAWHRYRIAAVFRHELSPESFERLPRAPLPAGERYQRIGAAIDREQHSALMIYDPFRPFIGAGETYEPWSFALELKRKKPEGRSDRLTSRQVLDLIRPQLERLRDASAATSRDRLKDLELEECVFLPAGPPRGQISYAPDEVARHIEGSVDEGAEARRLFLRIRVGAWDEQVVTTILVRVHTQGGMLVLEVVPHVLSPIRAEYKRGDAIAAQSGGGALREAVRALFTSPTASVASAFSAGRTIAGTFRLWLSDPRHALPDAPAASVRELGSVPGVWLFQEMDISRYVKTVQDRIVNGVREALRSQGYETGEFEQQVVNVAGGGVFIGGSMSGGAIASGAAAQANAGGSSSA
ncbi:hypothetical protein [Actinacidiphila soli]|uniref:hypothetical protein n=1 Tax=Actinacidiphila soli TaxID=2487275 RepID=UPI001F0B8BC9|nr:hypothetical protein [Actinacidiphila soli]